MNQSIGFFPIEQIFNEKRKPAKLTATPLAQSMDLMLAWRRAQEAKCLKPGDLAQEKEGLGIFGDECPVVVIWRLLDINDQEDRMIIRSYHKRYSASRVDCLVGRKFPNGSIIVVPHELERLEPYIEKEVTSITAEHVPARRKSPRKRA